MTLSPEMQETIVKIVAVAAAIGPLIMVGGKLTARDRQGNRPCW